MLQTPQICYWACWVSVYASLMPHVCLHAQLIVTACTSRCCRCHAVVHISSTRVDRSQVWPVYTGRNTFSNGGTGCRQMHLVLILTTRRCGVFWVVIDIIGVCEAHACNGDVPYYVDAFRASTHASKECPKCDKLTRSVDARTFHLTRHLYNYYITAQPL